jgi:hypothetical protein
MKFIKNLGILESAVVGLLTGALLGAVLLVVVVFSVSKTEAVVEPPPAVMNHVVAVPVRSMVAGDYANHYTEMLNEWKKNHPCTVLGIAGVLAYRSGLSQMLVSYSEVDNPEQTFVQVKTAAELPDGVRTFTTIPTYGGGVGGIIYIKE